MLVGERLIKPRIGASLSFLQSKVRFLSHIYVYIYHAHVCALLAHLSYECSTFILCICLRFELVYEISPFSCFKTNHMIIAQCMFESRDMKCFGDPMRLYFHLDQVRSLRRSPETTRARLGLVAKSQNPSLQIQTSGSFKTDV